MESVIKKIEARYKKPRLVNVRSGDSVKVHQKIREGNKERIQIFEGLVIRTSRPASHTASITVRRQASGIGVEKTYLLHSPLIIKLEVTKRSKVRRNYLTYMRQRTGKSARLTGVDFDRQAVNKVDEPVPAAPEKALSKDTKKTPAETASTDDSEEETPATKAAEDSQPDEVTEAEPSETSA